MKARDGSETRGETRHEVALPVRLMTSEGAEFAADLIDLSLGGAAFRCDTRLRPGTVLVVYVEGLGRFEAETVRVLPHGFAVCFAVSEARRERLRQKLGALLEGAPALEPQAAPAPRPAQGKRMTLADGRALDVTVLDASILGLTVAAATRPPLGTPVQVNGANAVVTRHDKGGFGVEFVRYWDTVSPWMGRSVGTNAHA